MRVFAFNPLSVLYGIERCCYFMKSGYIIYAIISLLILLLYGMVLFFPWRLPEQSEPVECTIQKGMGSVRIGSLLKEHGIIRYPFLFRLSGQILYMNRNLQAGTYLFQGRMNHYSIIQKLRRGDVTSRLVTLREGITAAQMAHILKEKIEIDSTAFMARVMDPVYARNSGTASPTLEGYLFPDTYQLHSKASPDEV